MDAREELVRLYRTYNPRRLKDIDEILARCKGREYAMVMALREKYARGGTSANPSFFGSSAAPWAEEPSRQTTAHEAAPAASVATALVGTAPWSSSVRPPPHFRVPDAPLYEGGTGDAAAEARALGTPMTSSCSTGAAIERAAAFASAAAASAERHRHRREMEQLIDQMCSVDVERLADRMALLAASATSQPSRAPRLQWRQSREASALEADDDRNGSEYNGRSSGELTELLRHTAVFLTFFSRCARRFLLLAEEVEEDLGAGAASAATHGTSLSLAPPLAEEPRTAIKSPPRRLRQRFHGTCDSVGNTEQMGSGAKGPSHDSGDHEDVYRCRSGGAADGDRRAWRGNDNRASSPKKSRTEHHVTIEPAPWYDEAAASAPSAATAPVHSHDARRADAAVSSGRRCPSCVRAIRQTPASPPAAPRSSTAFTPLPVTWREEDRMTSVGDRRGGSSSPSYRTTTVSPLTSPRSRHSEHSPRTPSPPRHSGRGARRSAATATAAARPHVGLRSPSAPLGSSPAATPPRPPTSPPKHGGALVLQSPPPARRRVYTWTPSSQPNRYADTCAALQSGDCVVLQPGVYYEELLLDNCGRVELTSAYPGAAVVLRPSSGLAPALRIRGACSQVELKGIVLVQGEGTETARATAKSARTGATAPAAPPSSSSSSAAPALPLLLVSNGAALQATACHFYGGAGGGVVIAGPDTRATLDLCLVSLCSFAGIYAHNHASVEVRQSRVKKCEAGLRVLQSSFHVHESTLEDNKTDGVVVYEGSQGALERSSVMNNGGNGLFLEGGAGEEVQVIASTIELNALYGVQRLRGSILHIRSSYIRDNGLLPINDEGG
ncbi:hypothetical protein LSCM1_08162 [Leishmania martiniquensis]|uniref:Right handed beta helix domain-containing protein n=1 Tax=Leishmania martiniquensis TaxID=1580590 RepID=A0A836I540_9TRYP|nr:hypothetical protein LSCM1_08162 [Leishmania martiniquensis]